MSERDWAADRKVCDDPSVVRHPRVCEGWGAALDEVARLTAGLGQVERAMEGALHHSMDDRARRITIEETRDFVAVLRGEVTP